MAKSININLQNTTQKRFINMNATADIKCYAVAAPCNLMLYGHGILHVGGT